MFCCVFGIQSRRRHHVQRARGSVQHFAWNQSADVATTVDVGRVARLWLSKSWRQLGWISRNKTLFLMKILFLCETFRKVQPQITSPPSYQASSLSRAAEVESNSPLCPQYTHLLNRRIDCYCIFGPPPGFLKRDLFWVCFLLNASMCYKG
jgi:hypothetical protein